MTTTQRKCSVCRQPGHTKRTCPQTRPRQVFDATECPICLEPLGIPTWTISCTTPCGHQFCMDCLVTARQHKTKCPICRSEIPGAAPAAVHRQTPPPPPPPPPPPTPPPTPNADRVHQDWLARFNAQYPPRTASQFDIFIKNPIHTAITFDIVWIPTPVRNPYATSQPRVIHTNISPGMTRKLSVGMRGHRFRLVVSHGRNHLPPGTFLAELHTSPGSTDNFVFTGNDLLELSYRFSGEYSTRAVESP